MEEVLLEVSTGEYLTRDLQLKEASIDVLCKKKTPLRSPLEEYHLVICSIEGQVICRLP